MKKSLLKNRNKKGFTLTEVLLVLGLAAIIIITIFLAYPKVLASMRSDTESKNISNIVAGVKGLYTASSTYTGLTNAVAANAKIFPDNMLNGSSTDPINTWKGNVTVAAAATGPSAAAGSSFTITYTAVPSNECAKLVTGLSANFYIVQVGSTVVKSATSTLDIPGTTTACNSGGNANTLVFTSL